MKQKDFGEFAPFDFVENPIWIPSDSLENEDEVIPWKKRDPLELEGVYYVATEFKLADGMTSEGFIRISEGKVTLLGVAVSETNFAFLLLVNVFRDLLGQTYENFAKQLGKKPNEVFPIKYHTQFRFTNNSLVQGEIA
jgi:hypothetical protein